jgi:hypothetical protein
MAADAKTRRLRQAASKPAAAPTSADRPVPFEIHGTLSDEALEALAGLLLEIVGADSTETTPEAQADDPHTSRLVP